MELRTPRFGYSRDLLIATVFALVQALFVRTFLAQGFRIPSGSMEPGLLAGDYILVNKLIYNLPPSRLSFLLPYREIQRGDVVVFQSPSGHSLIKRCVGLPGDFLETESGEIWLGGGGFGETGASPASNQTIRLAEHQYFFLGDHRKFSRDSRFFGPIARDSLIGRGILIYWSVEIEEHSIWDTIPTSRRASRGWFSEWRWHRIGRPIR